MILLFIGDQRRQVESLPERSRGLVLEVLDFQEGLLQDITPAALADLFYRAKVVEKGDEVERMLSGK